MIIQVYKDDFFAETSSNFWMPIVHFIKYGINKNTYVNSDIKNEIFSINTKQLKKVFKNNNFRSEKQLKLVRLFVVNKCMLDSKYYTDDRLNKFITVNFDSILRNGSYKLSIGDFRNNSQLFKKNLDVMNTRYVKLDIFSIKYSLSILYDFF